MAATLATRKPIVTIQVDDLEAFPIWEFCLNEESVEGMDETWVRPLNTKKIGRKADALTVSADLTAANGLATKGFVSVTTAGGFKVSGFGVPFPNYLFAMAPTSRSEKTLVASKLGAPADQIFPIAYRLRVALKGETKPREGTFA